MAKWIRFGRALRLPSVFGSKPNSKFGNEQTMKRALINEAQTNRVFARYTNGAPHNKMNIEVDVTSASVSHQPADSVAR